MSVRVNALDKAIAEAGRFLEAAEAVKRSAGISSYIKDDPEYEGGLYCAAVKRASMDLSKALAAVRHGVRTWK
jgi:hypothetical protein